MVVFVSFVVKRKEKNGIDRGGNIRTYVWETPPICPLQASTLKKGGIPSTHHSPKQQTTLNTRPTHTYQTQTQIYISQKCLYLFSYILLLRISSSSSFVRRTLYMPELPILAIFRTNRSGLRCRTQSSWLYTVRRYVRDFSPYSIFFDFPNFGGLKARGIVIEIVGDDADNVGDVSTILSGTGVLTTAGGGGGVDTTTVSGVVVVSTGGGTNVDTIAMSGSGSL